FLTTSGGSDQMARLDGRGGTDYSGLSKTSSWTSWSAPSPGIDESKNVWYKYDVIISNGKASAYIGSISDSLAKLGTTATSSFSISNNGDYLGLVGDALGSSYITYLDGIIIRSYPPNGVMPSAKFGILSSSTAPIISYQNLSTYYGIKDLISGLISNSSDSLDLYENGVLIAGPSKHLINYTICGTNPYINSCLIPGNYIFSVNDLTSNTSSSVNININKQIPSLKIESENLVLTSKAITPINYSVSTIGNQLKSTLSINGVNVSNSFSNNTYNFIPSNVGLYNLELSTTGNGNYLPNTISKTLCFISNPQSIPSNILFFSPICVVNNQSISATGPFQEIININESKYLNYIQYNGVNANFEIFNSSGDILPSWIEQNKSGNLSIWIKFPNGIQANSINPIYMGFAGNSLNLLSNNGSIGIGENPTATSIYGQYDDGNEVFNNYFSGGSLNGWTAVGVSGQTQTAPLGSPFGTNAFYANGANGDYLYTIANNQTDNSIIEYYTYTENLDDVFFLVNSTGSGQLGRLGEGGGWYGITSTTSWTSWTAPPDTGSWSNEWLLSSILINNGKAQMFLSTTPGIYGSEIGSNPSNIYSVSNNGVYLGFVGDADGSSTTQYLNGLIIRSYPPNGVMPYFIEGGIISVSQSSTCTISLNSNSIIFGSLNPSSSINTVNSIVDTNAGNSNSYLLVYGGNWLGNVQFGVSNTTWSSSNNVTYSNANKLSSTISNTSIEVQSKSSNSIYFGFHVPGGISPGNYQQTITIENSC
ncbi:MAG: hypothetical protein QXD23_03020, partial [Candidatus Micrarchaeaceae archaeon]